MFIYKIENSINGKIYVGKTNNPTERKAAHFRDYLKDKTKVLYKAMSKYGPENFEFLIIEECLDSIWEERERYWIQYYDSMSNGYNMIDGGSEPPHYFGEDHPLSKLTWDDIHIIKFELLEGSMLIKDIAAQFNISIDQIYRINTGESWSEDSDIFPIRSKNRLVEEDLNQIIWMLQNTNITQKDIGKMFNRTRTAITAINNGDNYFNKELIYPLRKGRNYNHK